MSRDLFPIAKSIGNELITTKGDLSYFYKLSSVDLEQMNEVELSAFYDGLSNDLDRFETNKFFKFYHLDGENYLNTNDRAFDLLLEAKEEHRALEIFFESKEIYSDLRFFDDYLNFNGLYKRVISIKGFSADELFSGAIPLGVDYILNLRRINTSSSLKRLERIRSSHMAALNKSKQDFSSSGAYEQAENLIHALTHGEESLFEIELYFLPKAQSLEELNQLTMKLITKLSSIGFEAVIEGNSIKNFKSGLSHIFKGLVPGVPPEFNMRELPDKTTHLRYLLPVSRSFLMNSGTQFHDVNSEKLSLDFFSDSLKNRNILVTGSTGGGKSVLVNKITHDLAPNHPVVILDKGGSFKKLCLYHDGYNLKDQINPMDFRCPHFLREFILSVVDKESFNKLKRGLLLRDIRTFLELGEDLSFFDLLDCLERNFEGITLYFEDLKEFISIESTPIKNFLYVDIENFPKTQVSPLIIYVLEYFKMLKSVQKVLVFDECYSFLKGHEEYLDESFRQIRKTGAMAIAIAQGYSDFSSSNKDLYNSFTNNTFLKFFFLQDSIKARDISEFDNFRISSLEYRKGEYSECYLKSQDGKFKKTLRIFLTPLEYELFHTEIKRNTSFYNFIEKNKEFFESSKDLIKSFVRLRNENI